MAQTQTQTQTQKQAPWTNNGTPAPRQDLGLDTKAQGDVVKQVEQVLVDTYVLYTKTQNAHWNVTGPMFHSLHGLFDEQYNELFAALDTIAERIRMLGHTAPATMKQFLDRTNIREWDAPPAPDRMISDLVKDHEAAIHELRDLSERAAKAKDEGTVDLAAERLRAHEQHAWMLRVHLE